MTSVQRVRFWLIGAVGFLLMVWLLRGVLLPFVAGMAVAYFFDPVTDRMERAGLSRTLATAIVTLVFFGIGAVLMVLLVPVVQQQVVAFGQRVPVYVDALVMRAAPLIEELQHRLSAGDIERLRASAGGFAGTATFAFARTGCFAAAPAAVSTDARALPDGLARAFAGWLTCPSTSCSRASKACSTSVTRRSTSGTTERSEVIDMKVSSA